MSLRVLARSCSLLLGSRRFLLADRLGDDRIQSLQYLSLNLCQWAGDSATCSQLVPPTTQLKSYLGDVVVWFGAHADFYIAVFLFRENYSHIRFIGTDKEADQTGISAFFVSCLVAHVL